MKSKKKMVAICSLSLIVVLAIAGTLAYFTDSKTKTNNFTIAGNENNGVGTDISLIEPTWDNLDSEGDPIDPMVNPDDLGIKKAIDAFPGTVIPKDPTVIVNKGPVYLRFKLTFTDSNGVAINEEAKINAIIGMISGLNTNFDQSAITSGAIYFTRNTAANALEEFKLFDTVTIPSAWNKAETEDFGDFNIVIEGQAIQSENFDNVTAAFAAFDGQVAP